jgi:hypothetical protein
MITTIITVWFISLLSLLVGYLLGRGGGQTIHQLKEKIGDIQKSQIPVGEILRPTQKDIIERRNPTIMEGKNEFKKLLDKIINKNE